jgi:hypothetical protein
MCPIPPGPSWAVLASLSGVLVRGVGVAAVTVPAGVLLASISRARPMEFRPEWSEQERRRRGRAEARTRAKAARLVARDSVASSDALAVALQEAPSLPSWRRGRLVVPPAGQLGLTTLLVGGPGTGKSTTIERIAYLAGRERRELALLDGKGTDDLDQAVAAAYLAGWPDARVASFPQRPLDLWRGTPQQLTNRLAAAWQFSDEAEFYEQAALLALRLALAQPGRPCASTVELVARLDPAALARAWQGHPTELGVIRGMDKRLGDVALRASNLAAALGPAWDGDWWLPDVDLATFTVPTLDNPKDGDAAMRVLVAAYAQHVTRRTGRRPSLLVFDEFSALEGGRRQALNLVERARSAGSGVVLAGQSAAGLGSESERERLLAAAAAVILFRSPMPAELAALAGSERVAEAAWQLEGDELTGRATVTERHRARVDQDAIRAARTGEATIIAAGRVERCIVLRAPKGEDQPCPAGPAGADATRGLPPPVQPRQDLATRPQAASGLDPSGRSSVRRHRPPQADAGDPGSDRDNHQEAS